MIRHTVAFRLKHTPGSRAEEAFLDATRELAQIPGTDNFEVLRQTGSKNPFTFGISMEFSDAAAFARYNEHPAHTQFVRERWLPEVTEFLELDYSPL